MRMRRFGNLNQGPPARRFCAAGPNRINRVQYLSGRALSRAAHFQAYLSMARARAERAIADARRNFALALLLGAALPGLAQAERHTIPLFVLAGLPGSPQGVLRIVNNGDEAGTVTIHAIDDTGTRTGPSTFTLNASATAQFTATELQSGNATLGLTGGIGTGVGDARLEIETDIAIVPLAFVRAADGTLSAMHDTVRGASVAGSDGQTYEVPSFNPASEVTHVSRLRLINPGDAAAAVTISGRDDSGTVTRGTVTGTAAGTGDVDRFPTFRTATHPGDRTYTEDTAIDALTLPEASGGNGTLTYTLSPNVPGLTFNATTRQLTGTPSTAGTYSMTYTVTDEDGDTDSLSFTVTVSDDTTETGSLGVCQVGMLLSSGQSCTYPGTTDPFSVNVRGRGSFPGPPGRYPHPDQQRDDRRASVRLPCLAPGRRSMAN